MRKLALASLLITSNLTNSNITAVTNNITKEIAYDKIDFIKEASLTSINANKYLKQQFKTQALNIPLSFPLDTKGFKRVSDYFGMRIHPIKKTFLMHKGLDLAGILGTDVYSAASGTVKKVQRSKGYGLYIIIDHGNGITSLYGHLNKVLVKKGDKIEIGQTIALLGNSGVSTGPHLHFEIRMHKESIDPLLLLKCEKEELVSTMLTFKKFKKWELQNYLLKIS